MFITDPEKLTGFYSNKRIWQGIPSLEKTKGGRLFAAFYSGNVTEALGNFDLVLKSDDDGKSWSEPIAVAYKSEIYRCYDPCLWIDPLGRLWLFFGSMPETAVYAVICDNPDADTLIWSDEIRIADGIMINKPTVLSTGEWLLPIAVWDHDVCVLSAYRTMLGQSSGAFVYKSSDNGKSFTKLGCPHIASRSYDEHMTYEKKDGSLVMLSRTNYGISKSHSYDGGHTWSVAEDSKIGGPCSRFFVRRLKSGRLLLVNHYKFSGRNNLTALLSEDDGETWKYSLLLDEQKDVSYPDGNEGENGFIYIIYDHERGAYQKCFEDAKKLSREILMAKFTEEDIINGSLVNRDSRLKCIVSKLGEFDGDPQSMYAAHFTFKHYSDDDLRELLSRTDDNDKVLAELFTLYDINCKNLNLVDVAGLDECIGKFRNGLGDREKLFGRITSILNSVKTARPPRSEPIADFALEYIGAHFTEPITVEEIAEKAGVSIYYLCHVFKAKVGISIIDYRNTRRMSLAKKLLAETDKSVTDIAGECGFDDFNYFIRRFGRTEGMSPLKYREYRKH